MPVKLASRFLADASVGLSSRDSGLLRRAVETLVGNTVGPEGKPWAPHRGIIPSFGTYEGVWNWDAAFHALAVARWDPELAWEQAYVFFDHQRSDGGFVDVLWSAGGIVDDFGKPPVWPWALRLVEERAPGQGDLRRAYDSFVSNERHWLERRCQGGFFHYDSASREGDWIQQAKFESGWDNSVRWDGGIVEVWPVDLNGYMTMYYEAMAFFAEQLRLDFSNWRSKAIAQAKNLEERLWNDAAGAYMDFNFKTGQFTGVLTPASFVPLFCGSASPARAARMAELAADPAAFFPGLPTVAYSDPAYSRDMWRGPCWLNTAYFALDGLRRYGFVEVADRIRETILDWCAAEEHLREYYDARTGEGLAAVGFGWTAAFVIELILDWRSTSSVES
ncbi:MAG: amylo-alpha-1,6-glucosidase [Fimbriimonadales bacterium]